MAWNVRENLMSFDMEVYIVTNQEDITKTRYIDERYNQQILRVDDESLLKPMEYELPEDKFDALVISDYDKGYVDYNLFDILAPKNPNIKIFVLLGHNPYRASLYARLCQCQ